MPDKKLFGGAVVVAALAVGGVAGAMLGTPSLLSAQTGDTTTTTVPDSRGTDDSERRPGLRRHHLGIKPGLDAAAEALGISEDDLRDQLRDGKSIANVASERNVNLQTVIDTMVREVTARIDDAVADGDLDADDAAEMKEGLVERITDAVNREGGGECGPGRVGPPGGPRPGGHGLALGGGLDAAAEALGISEDDLHDELRDGNSIADVASERNVNLQAVIDAMVREATARIDDAVADGDLETEDAVELKEDLVDRITDMVNADGGLRRFGPGRRGR